MLESLKQNVTTVYRYVRNVSDVTTTNLCSVTAIVAFWTFCVLFTVRRVKYYCISSCFLVVCQLSFRL